MFTYIHGQFAKNLREGPQYAILFVKYNKTDRPGATDKTAKTDEGEGGVQDVNFEFSGCVLKQNCSSVDKIKKSHIINVEGREIWLSKA